MYDISVIVPCYNMEQYLERMFDSLVIQENVNFEVVLVDDASENLYYNKSSKEICENYKDKLNITYIKHDKNMGLFQTRRDGFFKSTGKYVFIIDTDDYIEKDCLSILLNKMIKTDADIVSPTIVHIKDNGNLSHYTGFAPFESFCGYDYKNITEIMQRVQCYIIGSLYKRKVWENVYKIIPENTYLTSSEDVLSTLLFVLNKDRRYAITDKLYYHVLGTGFSTSNKKFSIPSFIKQNTFQTYVDILKNILIPKYPYAIEELNYEILKAEDIIKTYKRFTIKK